VHQPRSLHTGLRAQGAKASVDITYWPHALRARVELRTRCRVREIATSKHGMASGVVYYDPSALLLLDLPQECGWRRIHDQYHGRSRHS